MIKCYQVRRLELVVDKEPTLFYQGPIVVPLIATIDSNEENLEDIWDCCNNSCWWGREDYKQMTEYKGKFAVEFTDDYSGFCNDDLIVAMNGKVFLAKSVGWKEFSSLSDAVDDACEHSHWVQLHDKNTQHPEGRELSMKELQDIKNEYEARGIKCFLYRN